MGAVCRMIHSYLLYITAHLYSLWSLHTWSWKWHGIWRFDFSTWWFGYHYPICGPRYVYTLGYSINWIQLLQKIAMYMKCNTYLMVTRYNNTFCSAGRPHRQRIYHSMHSPHWCWQYCCPPRNFACRNSWGRTMCQGERSGEVEIITTSSAQPEEWLQWYDQARLVWPAAHRKQS